VQKYIFLPKRLINKINFVLYLWPWIDRSRKSWLFIKIWHYSDWECEEIVFFKKSERVRKEIFQTADATDTFSTYFTMFKKKIFGHSLFIWSI